MSHRPAYTHVAIPCTIPAKLRAIEGYITDRLGPYRVGSEYRVPTAVAIKLVIDVPGFIRPMLGSYGFEKITPAVCLPATPAAVDACVAWLRSGGIEAQVL